MKNVRTRFAPSPTGYIHVGNVRSALYPYFIARKNKGQFILRIEDTDQNRFVEGAEALILDILSWLGIDWDEGPEASGEGEKGDFFPYHQTKRKDIYKKWAQKLIDMDRAYVDNRSAEEINALKNQAKESGKLFLYRDHRPDNLQPWGDGLPLRFKIDKAKPYQWHDEVMGDLSAGADAVDDFIIMKSDGLPTYNFAHIIDDCEMKISHVVRGQEYISSMPKYLALYEALNIEPPKFAHLPHILAPNGNKKLGKRDGAKSVVEYRSDGYLPEAVLNFLACLGWNDGTEREIFTKDDLIDQFNFDRVNKSGARFDEKRLLWMNCQWIRRLDLDDLLSRCDGFWGVYGDKASDQQKKTVLAVVQERLKTLRDLPSLSEYFFAKPKINLEMLTTNKVFKKIDLKCLADLLSLAKTNLDQADFNDEADIQKKLNELLVVSGEKPMVMFGIIRFALTWARFSPGLPETMRLLGKEETMDRLNESIKAIKAFC